MTVVLALDIAMHRTGWALGGDDWEKPRWGTFETERWADNEGKNLNRFREWLDSVGNTFALTHVVLEEVFVNVGREGVAFQFNGTQAQMMLSGVALEWAYSRKLGAAQVGIDDWRKRFLGLNRKPKDFRSDKNYWKTLALKVAAQRNWYCEHHDEAEALGILDYALSCLSKPYARRTLRNPAKQERDIDRKTGVHA